MCLKMPVHLHDDEDYKDSDWSSAPDEEFGPMTGAMTSVFPVMRTELNKMSAPSGMRILDIYMFLFLSLLPCFHLVEVIEEVEQTDYQAFAAPTEELMDNDSEDVEDMQSAGLGNSDDGSNASLDEWDEDIVDEEGPSITVHYGSSPAIKLQDILNSGEGAMKSLLPQTLPVTLDIEKLKTDNATDLALNGTGDKKKITCTPRNITENYTLNVRIVNGTELLQSLGAKNGTQGNCAVVLFYAPWCMFCARVAPHYNALARVFPQLDIMAIDAIHFSNLNARFGTIAVPNILVFHNAKAVARFNNSVRTLDTLRDFVSNVTGLSGNESEIVEATDYEGPVSSQPTQDPDYLLWLSWVILLSFCGVMVKRSQVGQRVFTMLASFGQEHQHQHID